MGKESLSLKPSCWLRTGNTGSWVWLFPKLKHSILDSKVKYKGEHREKRTAKGWELTRKYVWNRFNCLLLAFSTIVLLHLLFFSLKVKSELKNTLLNWQIFITCKLPNCLLILFFFFFSSPPHAKIHQMLQCYMVWDMFYLPGPSYSVSYT